MQWVGLVDLLASFDQFCNCIDCEVKVVKHSLAPNLGFMMHTNSKPRGMCDHRLAPRPSWCAHLRPRDDRVASAVRGGCGRPCAGGRQDASTRAESWVGRVVHGWKLGECAARVLRALWR